MARNGLFSEFIVKDDERAFLYRDGSFVRLLTPGLNREFDLSRRLSAEVARAVRSPLAVERLGEQGFDALGSAPEEFGSFLERDLVKVTRIVKEANIKVE